MLAIAADRTLMWTLMDYIKVTQNNQGDAIQQMWAMNQHKSGSLTATAGSHTTDAFDRQTVTNLALWDPFSLYTIFNTYFVSPDGPVPTKQLFINKCSVSARITNVESTACELIEYRCKARRSQASISETGPPVYKGLDAMLRHGADSELMGSTARPYFSRQGCTVFDISRFCRENKVLKTRTWNLSPGQTIEIGYKSKKGRTIKYGDIFQQSGTSGDSEIISDVAKGQTFSVFVLRGTLVGLSTNESAGAVGLGIGLSNAALGIQYRYKFHFRNLHPESRQTAIIQPVPGIVGGFAAAPTMAQVTITGGGTDGTGDIDQVGV